MTLRNPYQADHATGPRNRRLAFRNAVVGSNSPTYLTNLSTPSSAQPTKPRDGRSPSTRTGLARERRYRRVQRGNHPADARKAALFRFADETPTPVLASTAYKWLGAMHKFTPLLYDGVWLANADWWESGE